jgi:P4 family phage/plasmid primase-like protien
MRLKPFQVTDHFMKTDVLLPSSIPIGANIEDVQMTVKKNLPANINMADATKFLNLFGVEKPQTFQAFLERNKKSGNEDPAKIFHGTFAEHKSALVALNNEGYAICLMSNQLGRKGTDIKKIRAVFVDLDGAPPDSVKNAKIKTHAAVESSPDRFHGYWLVTDCLLDNFKRIQKAIAEKYDGDPVVCDLPRVMRLPGFIHWKGRPFTSRLLRCRKTLAHYTVTQIIEGLELDVDLDSESKSILPPAMKGTAVEKLVVSAPTAEKIIAALKYIPADDREIWLRIGMALHSLGWDHNGFKIWCEWSSKSSKFDLAMQKKTWDNFKPDGGVGIGTLFYLAKLNGATESFGDGPQYSLSKYPATDLGNSKFLVDQVDGYLYIVLETHELIWWNGSRWETNENQLNTAAVAAVESIGHAAKQCSDEAYRAALQKHSVICQSKARIDAMAGLAKKHPRLGISQVKLDADPMLLGVQNGVIDLTTGELKLAVPEDLITQFASVSYDLAAECQLFKKFVHDIMDGDEEMIVYLQKAAGYGLTGIVKEHVLFILFGKGRNGKTLLIRILQRLLGQYAIQMQPTLLMQNRFSNHGPTPELAGLPGKRMLCLSEVGENHEMHSVLVKQLTGGDKVSARPLYAKSIEFDPLFKIWMTGNSKPRAAAEDDALWQRFHLMPFLRQFLGKRQDKNLEATLMAELPGILNWCIKWCLMWQEKGLKLPRASQEALSQYRDAMDTVSHWLENCCEESAKGKIPVTLAFGLYSEWCQKSKERALSRANFKIEMLTRFNVVRRSQGIYYRGVKLNQQ